MQDDGNLVLYDSGNNATWSTQTNGQGSSGYFAKIQNDGNFVVYDKDNNALWATGTNI